MGTRRVRVVAASDIHGFADQLSLPDGDILILAGDYSGSGSELRAFLRWLKRQAGRYQDVALIPGNHDEALMLPTLRALIESYGVHPLIGREGTFQGLRIYGQPFTPQLGTWPWMASPERLAQIWAAVPAGLDILVSHGPPYGILDIGEDGEHAGDPAFAANLARMRPRVVLCGHIHEQAGRLGTANDRATAIRNVSVVDENYELINRTGTIIDLDL